MALGSTTGFAHFDASHRENFCAAVLLFTMELEDDVRSAVVEVVRAALNIPASSRLVALGREARLPKTEDDTYARVDIWFLFEDVGHAFLEVKTHNGWAAEHVAKQVRDQETPPHLARSRAAIHGCALLAPERLCSRVRAFDRSIATISWKELLQKLRGLPTPSRLTQSALRHLEDNVDRQTGIADRTLDDFESATTTIACLRQFLLECIADVGADARRNLVYMTPGDGKPRRGSGWAWFGLSVPFVTEEGRYRLGIYKYVEAPPDEADASKTLWLEAYAEDDDLPTTSVEFHPTSLDAAELDGVREAFKRAWQSRRAAAKR